MKKVISILIFLTAFSFVFVSCKQNTDDEGNTTNQSDSGAGGNGGGNRPAPVPPKENITIDETTYEYTGEVQLMTAQAIITGSDDYNKNYTGAFPKGRTVTLSPFIMGKYEVTQELYEAVMTGKTEGGKALSAKPSTCVATGTNFKLLSDEEQKYRPVENVTWFDACYFCNVLSDKMGLTKAYNINVTTVSSNGNITEATVEPVKGANGYRLPTEAEWEYAARGGSKSTEEQFKQYFSGATTTNYSDSENDEINGVAWYFYNAFNLGSETEGYGTHQVGNKAPNAAVLCDMSGNVRKWCYDLFDDISTTETVTDPSGPSEAQTFRVVRGGSWDSFSNYCAVSYRYSGYPDDCYRSLGFRVVRNAQ